MVGPKCGKCGGESFATSSLKRAAATDVVFVHCAECGQIAGVAIEPPGCSEDSPIQAVVQSSPANPIHVTDGNDKSREVFI